METIGTKRRRACALIAATAAAAAAGVAGAYGEGARHGGTRAYPPAPRSTLRGKIAFNRDRGGIWVMNADGSGRRRITNPPPAAGGGATDYDPSWSPDGKRIVFRTERGRYVRDPHGSGAQGIFVVDVRTRREREIQPRTGGLFPAWSPNGKWIAMTGVRAGRESIVVEKPDGTLVRKIDLQIQAGECSTWSPDSSRIAFCGHDGDGNWAVWVMRADGTDQRQLTHPKLVQPAGTGGDYPGAWSPDGKEIAYSAGQDASREGWIVDADGTDPRRLTHWRGSDAPVAWLPDGRIVFAHETSGPVGHRFYAMNADGTRIRSLPLLAGVGELDWLWAPR
jgi:Tol biopolymer transport system component